MKLSVTINTYNIIIWWYCIWCYYRDPVHMSHFLKKKQKAKSKNIELIYIPTELTCKYQPLDVLINRILKRKVKMLCKKEILKIQILNN